MASGQSHGLVHYRGRPLVDEFDEITRLNGYASEIIPGLFLGAAEAAFKHMKRDLDELRVVLIVNATMDRESVNEFEGCGITYVRIAINDSEHAHMLPYFDGTSDCIDRTIDQGCSVLVHCRQGISRSASIVIAFLMKHRKMSKEEAYIFVKKRRPVVAPNEGFWSQLTVFETQLSGPAALCSDSVSQHSLDEAWCRASCAKYIVGDVKRAFSELVDGPVSLQHKALLAALDFVLGRAMLLSDISWMRAMCRALDELSTDDVTSIDFLKGYIITEDFHDKWDCDFRPVQLRLLLDRLTLDQMEPGASIVNGIPPKISYHS
jgi:hypothetical protein